MFAWLIPTVKAALLALVPDMLRTGWERFKERPKASEAFPTPRDGTGAKGQARPVRRRVPVEGKVYHISDQDGAVDVRSLVCLLVYAFAVISFGVSVLLMLGAMGGCTPARIGALKMQLPPPVTLNTLQEVADYASIHAPCPDCPECDDTSIPVPPAPVPPPENPADTGDAGIDALDPKSIVWRHGSPASFPITATLKNVRVKLPQTISWEWTAPADWPVEGNGVIGNMWVCGRFSGKVNCATWEWVRRNTFTKPTEAKPGQPVFLQSKVEPLRSWRPKHGEDVWWMMSSPCRGGCRGVKGRSPIVKGVWP